MSLIERIRELFTNVETTTEEGGQKTVSFEDVEHVIKDFGEVREELGEIDTPPSTAEEQAGGTTTVNDVQYATIEEVAKLTEEINALKAVLTIDNNVASTATEEEIWL